MAFDPRDHRKSCRVPVANKMRNRVKHTEHGNGFAGAQLVRHQQASHGRSWMHEERYHPLVQTIRVLGGTRHRLRSARAMVIPFRAVQSSTTQQIGGVRIESGLRCILSAKDG